MQHKEVGGESGAELWCLWPVENLAKNECHDQERKRTIREFGTEGKKAQGSEARRLSFVNGTLSLGFSLEG